MLKQTGKDPVFGNPFLRGLITQDPWCDLAMIRSANTDLDTHVIREVQMLVDGFNTIVTTMTTTAFDAQLQRRQVQVIINNVNSLRRYTIIMANRRNWLAAPVHKHLRFCEQYLSRIHLPVGNFRMKPHRRGKIQIQASGKHVKETESGIVPVIPVLPSGIAQTNEQFQMPSRWRLLLAPLQLLPLQRS